MTILLAHLTGEMNAARILGIFPLGAKSHFGISEAILKSLHAAGHEVTMATPYPSGNEIENFKYITINESIYDGQARIENFIDMSLNYAIKHVVQYCRHVMNTPEIQVSSRNC